MQRESASREECRLGCTSMSGQYQPSQAGRAYPSLLHSFALCSLILPALHSSQELGQKPCKASDIFSALLCSNAASSKRSKNAFAKSSSAFSHLLLLFLIPFSRLQLINVQEDFYQSAFYFCSSQQMTQQMNPVHSGAGFQLFALHISPTFASNLKSCSRQILNLFRKNRAPWIFHLSARARVQSSMARLMNLTLKRAKSKGNISSKSKTCI